MVVMVCDKDTPEHPKRSFFSIIFVGLVKDTVIFGGQTFTVLVEKGLYWEAEKMLIISDVHLGKSNHFRKSGIALSLGAELSDLDKIAQLIRFYQPETVVFLGDLFHSQYNVQWELFTEWIQQFNQVHFQLVIGNHDLLSEQDYQVSGLTSVDLLEIHGICLSHEPLEMESGYNICGHIHPGIKLVGKANQSAKIPCFLVKKHQMILPAFGSLTGLYLIEPKEDELVFGVAGTSLFRYE